ncbi:MAG TPA: hypothetical protein VF941_00080 [Clostridia bacterium]
MGEIGEINKTDDFYEIIPWDQYYNLVRKHFNIQHPKNIDNFFLSGLTGERINAEVYRANEWWELYLEDIKMLNLLEN